MSRIAITGANRGIGLELTRQLSARGDEVIALVRSPSSELQELGVEIIAGLDMSADDLSEASRKLGDRDLDILINNAGILRRTGLDDLDLPSIRQQFEVNALGPLKITSALAKHLTSGSKVAHVTSRMGSIEDNSSGSHYGYRMSKAAVNMAGASLAHDLKEQGVAVILLHPGYVSTDMTAHKGTVEPEDSAAGLLSRIDALDLGTSGEFRHMDGTQLPW